jgi:uncharacterized protein
MRIGLITDTHIPWVEKKIPQEVFHAFQGVDLILHAGDIYSHVVLDDLEKIAPVLAALGDDDYPGPDERVKDKHIIQIGSHVIWLIHEGPSVPTSVKWLPMWLKNRLNHDEKYVKPDIIVSGHEHRPVIDRTDGIIHINSGSATYLGYKPGLGTIGILDISSGSSSISIMRLSNLEESYMESHF